MKANIFLPTDPPEYWEPDPTRAEEQAYGYGNDLEAIQNEVADSSEVAGLAKAALAIDRLADRMKREDPEIPRDNLRDEANGLLYSIAYVLAGEEEFADVKQITIENLAGIVCRLRTWKEES